MAPARAPARDVESQESCAATHCAGNGHPAVAALVAPFVLAWNAIDAYLTPCLGAYARLGARGAMGSLCCCLLECFRYEDKVWAGDAALGVDCEFRGCDWARVGDLSAGSEDKPMVLYQGIIEPRDCVQGQLGDCWLVSALACLAEHPGAIKRLILNGEKSLRGKYRVRFYDGKEKRWVTVTVDDLIPCYKGTKNPIFMQPHNNEFWPLIVEKAMAKFMGSYAALDGGFGTWATHALTGDNVFLLKKRMDVERTWRRHNMKFIGKPGDGGKKDRIYHEEVEENIVRDKLFNILTQYDSIKSLIAVSRMTKNGESKDETTGLVSGHLFSVISVRWAGRSWGVGGKRFIKLRNPWSTFEWKGAWADGSKEWDKHPAIAKELAYVNDRHDGVFWMEFDDFCEYFNQIAVCDRTTKRDFSLRYDHDNKYCGPLMGCVSGCACFWCGCQGPYKLYCGHQSTTETRQATKCCGTMKVANDA
jgi:hypothetical protein